MPTRPDRFRPMTERRTQRPTIDLAEERGLPVEWIPISSGARIAMDSGTENLDATARVARRIVTFTQAGGTIHVIVPGVNVGAQSYFDAFCLSQGRQTDAPCLRDSVVNPVCHFQFEFSQRDGLRTHVTKKDDLS